jgi:hypothetical protein
MMAWRAALLGRGGAPHDLVPAGYSAWNAAAFEPAGRHGGNRESRPPDRAAAGAPGVRVASARKLAHFALDRTPDGTGERGVDEPLVPVLRQLCDNLRNAFDGRAAAPAAANLRSVWGLFVLRAYWLESTEARSTGWSA